MRIIASVQSKRGSSRGLVHYLAHSKLDPDKEPEKGRELFNAFTDQLDVRNANNFLKSDCGRGRPTNDELHHLVLSFRPEDFHDLGSTDELRKRRLKAVTRFAISQLEQNLRSERLAWAGAVHLNTANPHVHIAIQKRYLTKDLHIRSLNKIPREALPHFEINAGQKQMVDGIFIESAKTKLEELIAQHGPSRDHAKNQSTSRTHHETDGQNSGGSMDEREALRLGILAEYQLKLREERVSFLIENRENLKFPVSDPDTGMKRKVSITELEASASGFSNLVNIAEARQIRAITHSILAKEESEFFKLKEDTADVREKAGRIRKAHKKNGTKLPSPAFSKRELDDLQYQCLANTQMRQFLFLEQIRIDLETTKEIQPRDIKDLERLAAQETLHELRLRDQQRKLLDFQDNSYYRKVPVGKEQISLAMIDGESRAKDYTGRSILRSIRAAIQSLTNKESHRNNKSNNSLLTEVVNIRLNEQSTVLQKDAETGRKVVDVLHKILARNTGEMETAPKFSAEELLEIDLLTRRLRLSKEYSANWNRQRRLIGESEGPRLNTTGTFNETTLTQTKDIVARRTLSREILSNIELNKAKEDLGFYRKSKRFHKFAIEDERSGSRTYLSLNDVDLPRKGSVLDHGLHLLLESTDHRLLRREIERRVKERDDYLNANVVAAKKLVLEAGKEAAAFKQNSWWQPSGESNYQPTFTVKEVAEINKRSAIDPDRKEATKLRAVLEEFGSNNSSTYNEILSIASLPEPKPEMVQKHSAQVKGQISIVPGKQGRRENNVDRER